MSVVIFAIYWVLKFSKKRDKIRQEPLQPDDIFNLVSRVKYPSQPEKHEKNKLKPNGVFPLPSPEQDKKPKPIDLINNRKNIIASMQALVEKYSLSEITIATDDGLVFASSANHDVQGDAAKFSQIARRQEAPDETDVTLFELNHKDSHLIGIIRTENELHQDWKKDIREDTKAHFTMVVVTKLLT